MIYGYVPLLVVALSVAVMHHNALRIRPANQFLFNHKPLLMGRASAVRANTKAKTDATKAKNNCHFAKKVIMAVKVGGKEPGVNKLLAQVIADAKAANIPKEIISRNINRASHLATANFKESVFEFYGHGGAGMLINVVTDNSNRATSEVKLVAKKHSLKEAATNSVLFKFAKKAHLRLSTLIIEDHLLDICLSLNIDDYVLQEYSNSDVSCVLQSGEASSIFVSPNDMPALRDTLRSKGWLVDTELTLLPRDGYTFLNREQFDANKLALKSFEALDDVVSVAHNFKILTAT